MAWIESHQDLAQHPKVERLALALGIRDEEISHHVATSLLHHLWWWALSYAPSGDLSRFTPAEIARACRWPRAKGEALVEALVASRWLDREGERLVVHDYAERIEPLIRRREQNKERARTSRARYAHGTGTVREACGATEPVPTEPNRTNPKEKKARAHGSADDHAATLAWFGEHEHLAPDEAAWALAAMREHGVTRITAARWARERRAAPAEGTADAR